MVVTMHNAHYPQTIIQEGLTLCYYYTFMVSGVLSFFWLLESSHSSIVYF